MAQPELLLDTPFLTLPDPNVDVKGSVDPLRLTLIWDHFGRKVVHNLTTITNSVRQFSSLMLSVYFARQAIESGKVEEEGFMAAFLRSEQLIGYSRYTHDRDYSGQDIRGLRRIRRAMDGNKPSVPISEDRTGQILSNQRAYGLWGMFNVAARASGLMEMNSNDLTPDARDLVERIVLPKLNKSNPRNSAEVLRFLKPDTAKSFQPEGKDETLAKALAAAMGHEYTSEERQFYLSRLVRCDQAPEARFQADLWKQMEAVNRDQGWWKNDFGYEELTQIAERTSDPELRDHLENIAALEPLIGALDRLFTYLMGFQGQTIENAAQTIAPIWPTGSFAHLQWNRLEDLSGELQKGARSDTIGTRYLTIGRHLADGDLPGAIKSLFEQNAEVMAARGGGPWIALRDGRIDIRLRQQGRDLPSDEELPGIWMHSFFLDSLKSVGRVLMQAEVGRG